MLWFGGPQPLYSILVYTPDGTLLADVSRIMTKRSFTVTRNAADSISLGCDLYAAERAARQNQLGFDELWAEGINEVRIFRGDRPVAAGQMATVTSSVGTSGMTLELQVVGFLDLLKDRYLWPTNTTPGVSDTTLSDDVGEVMWWFIDYTQHDITSPGFALTNGSFGFMKGTIQPSRTLTDTWQPWATSIRDILIAITGRIDSVDMAFTVDKVFNVYSPGIGQRKPELLFQYPGNIVDFRVPKDATGLDNTAIVRGSGNGSDQQVVSVRQNTDAQVAFSRREVIVDYPDVNVLQTLSDYGDEALRLNSASSKVPDIVLDGRRGVPLGAYWIGDTVRFAVPNRPALAQLNGQEWRIAQITVDVNENDDEEITLRVALS
jgi:hypothetical protein